LDRPLFRKSGVTGINMHKNFNSSGRLSTGSEPASVGLNAQKEKELQATTKISSRIRLAFEECEDAIETVMQNNDNVVLKANAMNDLRDSLAKLWNERKSREFQFAQLINHIQCLLLNVPVEEITLTQVEAISSVIQQAAI